MTRESSDSGQSLPMISRRGTLYTAAGGVLGAPLVSATAKAQQSNTRANDPVEQEFLNLRAGVESLMNEMYHKDGEKKKFTGKIKVKNASIAKAIGRNLRRASGFLESEAKQEKSAG